MQKGLSLGALLVPVLAIGLIDWLSGPRISLALFYAIPIMLAGWFLGSWAALCTGAAASIGIYLGDLAQQVGALTLTAVWNATMRLIFVIAVGQFTARVRRDREKLRGLLNQETTARIATVHCGGWQVRVAVEKAHKAAPAEVSGRSGEFAVLKVHDNGTGIAEENIAQIFASFFTTPRAGEGTGLGLSITNEIIRDHGGWIEVESQQWKGSQFPVFLPMSPQVEKHPPR